MTNCAIDEAYDIQGLVRTGYGSLKAARYILLRIDDAEAAKPWLRSLSITSVEDCRAGERAEALQIAFAAPGLSKIGLNEAEMEGFVSEFIEGMANDESRSRRLGDVDASAPEHWEWGATEKEPHILLMVFARPESIEALDEKLRSDASAHGCTQIASDAATDMSGREAFGFHDGLSQPKLDWSGELQPGGSKDRDYRTEMAAGEVLLGHPNEYKLVAHYPQTGGLGRNGTYLVYRKLEQDVTGFWQWLRSIAGEDKALALAEKMMGRTLSGAPLSGLNQKEGLRGKNGFDFSGDADGHICPLASHIRRANPRLGDHPAGNTDWLGNLLGSLGFGGSAMHDAVASSRFHRILRRGRPYGEFCPYDQAMQPDAPKVRAGLHFLCLNASLARQFEFVQGAWIASPTFAGLANESDPILGARYSAAGVAPSDHFSYLDDQRVPRRVNGIPQFVRVRGGAYFFLPGLNGLRQILK